VKAEPVPLCPPQIPCELLSNRTGSLNLFVDNKNTTTTTNNNNNNIDDDNNNNNLVPLQLFNFGHYIQHPIF
jgi:hypothetical protein